MNALKKISLAIALSGLSAAAVAGSGYKYLGVAETIQEHSQWCWAASSANVLRWYGKTLSQCSIVNWAYNRNDACGNSTFNWNSTINTPNNLYGGGGSVQNILYNWGISNTAHSSALSWNTVVSDINANRPFVLRWGWYNGGGHIMSGYGYYDLDGTPMLGYMNPWPGEGYTWSNYAWSVNAAYDHTWTHSLRTQGNPPNTGGGGGGNTTNPPSTPSPTGIVTNGGFESGISPWATAFGGQISTSQAQRHGGSTSALIQNRSSYASGMVQRLTGKLESGKTYDFSLWMKLQNSSNDQGRVVLQFNNGSQYLDLGSYSVGSGWTQLRGRFTYSASSSTEVNLLVYGPGSGVSFYLDDVEISVAGR